ncbi:MAG: hypothetical protein ACLQU5_21960 [Isosphaeraceae bacterium]
MLHTRTRRKFTTLGLVPIYFAIAAFGLLAGADAADVSPPPILQWFEGTYKTMARRAPDLFVAGYGAVWVPPPGRADSGDQSVGYDPFDRFDLGQPGHLTLYGTEDGLKQVANTFHQAGVDLHIDFVINHDGFKDSGSRDNSNGVTFVQAGDYPGFIVTLPNDIDGDFHSAFAQGDKNGRLAGLIDIDHSKNHQFIRNPVPGFANDIRKGTKPAFGRIADVPDDNNRRFYPDQSLQPILLLDPRTGVQGIKVFPFNLAKPLDGDPVEENAMAYLMRNAQWLVQTIGADGFRIDAAKNVDGFVLDLFDRAVYRSSFRQQLDGSQKQIFSYCEAFDGNIPFLQTFVKKTINPSDPGRIGGNRDTLDFPFFFAIQANLTGNGIVNNWFNLHQANLDFNDDGLQNGSSGVKFVISHDKGGPGLSSVGYAYELMLPGNVVVYFNAKEFGPGRNFPQDGRGDALGGTFGDAITRLVNIRNSHGRGNYIERLLEKECFAFERESSAVVLLSNRLDAGFDSRTLKVAFAPGTPLVELTGNAADPVIDPHNDLPEVVVVNGDGTINVRFPRNTSPDGAFHGSGYLIYGLSGPQVPAGIELTDVDHVEPGEKPKPATNATALLTDVQVIKANSFVVKVKTTDVNLLGSIRDAPADGDNALIKVDGGRDINGDGAVDFRAPGDTDYGFEMFRDKSSPRIGPGAPGDGEFSQTIDATKLEKGLHFIEVRVFRHRTDGGPAIFTSLKKVISVQ